MTTRRRPHQRPNQRLKDPRGGLTAAGRRAFALKEGARLKPGVRKSERDMTPEDMRRKGRWATRFYGRSELPALIGVDSQLIRTH